MLRTEYSGRFPDGAVVSLVLPKPPKIMQHANQDAATGKRPMMLGA